MNVLINGQIDKHTGGQTQKHTEADKQKKHAWEGTRLKTEEKHRVSFSQRHKATLAEVYTAPERVYALQAHGFTLTGTKSKTQTCESCDLRT